MSKRKYERWTPERLEKAIKAYSGKTLRDAASAVGSDAKSLKAKFLAAGVTIRPYDRAKAQKKGAESQNFKKGRKLSRAGYVMILKKSPSKKLRGDQRYDWEHRLVMEKHLGRKLKKKEVVHHINGDTKDNRIENLALFESSGAHTRLKGVPWLSMPSCLRRWKILRLIRSRACAELLEALEDIASYPVAGMYCDGPCIKPDDMEAIRAAIAKAKREVV
jgi:hypothetical protein